MSILAAASQKFLHLPSIRLPKWPGFILSKHVSNAIETYAQAASTAYVTALRLPSNPSTTKPLDF